MRKIKEILRLKLDAKLSHEQIATALGISKGVVTKYVGLASAAGVTLSEVQGIDETQLHHRLAGSGTAAASSVSGCCNWRKQMY